MRTEDDYLGELDSVFFGEGLTRTSWAEGGFDFPGRESFCGTDERGLFGRGGCRGC